MWDIYVYFIQLALGLLLWALKFRHLPVGLKILGYTLLLTLLAEGYAAYLMFQRTTNFYLYHFLVPLQYTLFSCLFYSELKGGRARKTVLASIPLYLLVSSLILLLLQETSEVNTYARLLKNVLIICWAFLYCREIFLGLTVVQLEKEPMFWVSTGLFFYSLGNFFVEGLMNRILEVSYALAHALYFISIFLGLLLNITFLVAFALCGRSPRAVGKDGAPRRITLKKHV